MDDLFHALSAPARRAILDELFDRDSQTLFELVARMTARQGMPLSRQAISQHLAVLEAAGLVRTRRQGKFKFHDLDPAPLRSIAERWPVPQETPAP